MVINKSVNKLWALFSAFKNPWWAGCRDEFPQVDFYFDHLHLWRWEKLRFSIKTAKLAFAVPEAAGAYVIKYAIENKLWRLVCTKPILKFFAFRCVCSKNEFLVNKQFIACRRLDRSADVCWRKQTSWADSDGSVEAGESVRAGEHSRSFPRLSRSQASMSWVGNLSRMVLVSLASCVSALSMLTHTLTWCTWGIRYTSVCGTVPNQAIGTQSSGVFWQL